MKKVLVLSVLAGLGHIKSAEAFCKMIENNAKIKFKDPLENLFLRELINKVYIFLANYLPWFWNFLYKNKFASSKFGLYFFLFLIYYLRIKKLLKEDSYDMVVSFHPFASDALIFIKKSKKTSWKLVVVATDHHVHHLSVSKYVDKYIVPSQKVKEELLKKDIEEDKIGVFFIPFNDKKRKLDWELPAGKKVLISLGGYNIGPLIKIAKMIKDLPFYFFIICGKNKRLFVKLKNILKGKENFFILERIENLSEVLWQFDLFITKPGGLSTQEAIFAKIPMILLKPLEQEKGNFEFLIKNKVCLFLSKIKDLPKLIKECEEKRDKLKENLEKLCKNIDKDKLVKFIL